jgi:hypothetical protein
MSQFGYMGCDLENLRSRLTSQIAEFGTADAVSIAVQ